MYTQVFLGVVGHNGSYPSYKSNSVFISTADPSERESEPAFLVSPLYSLSSEGYSELPKLGHGTTITFFNIPKIFPNLKRIIDSLSVENKNQVWFTLGLPNVVVIDTPDHGLTNEVIDYCKQHKICVGFETWKLDESCSIEDYPEIAYDSIPDSEYSRLDFKIPDNLLLHEKFVVSEFKASANKILSSSFRSTPQYYPSHLKILSQAVELVTDLFYLRDNTDDFDPSEDLVELLANPEFLKDEIFNDTYGRIVQLNSSLSYVYSQVYAGAFPILDHIGIIRRYSLLGVGTAIHALYELLFQLEELFLVIPFEKHLSPDDEDNDYLKNDDREYIKKIPDELSELKSPSFHELSAWKSVGESIINRISPDKYTPLSDHLEFENFYNRFAFFSGRLGFREYDFTATAAIQVLVEAKTLRWNVANYTHEILHNHVRIILNEIIAINRIENEDYIKFIESKRPILVQYLEGNSFSDLDFNDFFFIVIMSYCVYSQYHGSLSDEWDKEKFDRVFNKGELDKLWLILPFAPDLEKLLKHCYRDISEIFVHVLDFAYIYKRDPKTYLRSIWNSWATVPMVSSNLNHYILRTLLILSIDVEKDTDDRFDLAISDLKDLCKEFKSDSYIFDKIHEKIDFKVIKETESSAEEIMKSDESDLRFRFHNCVMIADLAYTFFTAKVEDFVDRNDTEVLDNDRYGLSSLEFEKKDIKSKLRLVTSELIKTIEGIKGEYSERDSAWLLNALGSNYYKHD